MKSKVALKRDSDVEDAMNLPFEIKDLEMTYPQFSFVSDSTTFKPKVITVADSFYWGMYNMGFSKKNLELITRGRNITTSAWLILWPVAWKIPASQR